MVRREGCDGENKGAVGVRLARSRWGRVWGTLLTAAAATVLLSGVFAGVLHTTLRALSPVGP